MEGTLRKKISPKIEYWDHFKGSCLAFCELYSGLWVLFVLFGQISSVVLLRLQQSLTICLRLGFCGAMSGMTHQPSGGRGVLGVPCSFLTSFPSFFL